MIPSAHSLCKLFDTEQLDRFEFCSSFGHSELSRVFGGQVLAQSINAAYKTVDPLRQMHSVHAYFLRPGDTKLPIYFDVEIIRDGGSFSSRRVIANQEGEAIFNASVSYMCPEEGFEHQDSSIDVLLPDEIIEGAGNDVSQARTPPATKSSPTWQGLEAFEIRTVPETADSAESDNKTLQGYWFKTIEPLPEDDHFHQLALAFISDYRFITAALKPHGVNYFDKRLQAASIDHSLWIHRQIRADEWIYFNMSSPSAGGGRGLNLGYFYDQQGGLVASAVQEVLMRLRR